MGQRTVKGFDVRTERLYDLTHHMWVEVLEGSRVRVGMDALGVETSGTLAHLSMVGPGSRVVAGEQFGSLEAEKYVGPLVAPVTGAVVAVNEAVLDDPGVVHTDPYQQGWMIEVQADDLEGDAGRLIAGEEEIVAAFDRKVTEYRLEGVLAE